MIGITFKETNILLGLLLRLDTYFFHLPRVIFGS